MSKAVDGRSAVAKAVKADLYEQLRVALTKPVESTSKGKGKKTKSVSKSWTQDFIDRMLKEARLHPNSSIGQLIARQIMADGIIEKLDAETDKYLARDIDFNEFRLLKTLYDEQRNVFLDTDRKKIAIGSRRIGKTELASRLLLKDVLKSNRNALYIHVKFDNAIRQCYGKTLDLAKSLGLPIAHESKSDGEITMSNGSQILFRGNNNKAEADKMLGFKFSLIIIDEVQTQCNLRYLIDVVLKPTLADYEDSTIILLGTPPRVAKTYCEEIWREYKGWKRYSWDMTKNPYLHDVEKTIKEICDEKGITEDAPFIQREYRGKWVYDIEAMVFKDYKTVKGIPMSFVPTDVAIGCDYGFQDYNAIVSLAYNRNTKIGYVISQCKFNKGTISDLIDVCRKSYEYAKKFCIERNQSMDFSKIAFYCDTNEQSISYEMSTQYNLPVYNCYKHNKQMALAQLSEWCRTGKINIEEGSMLEDEFQRTVYKRDEQDNILSEIDDDIFHPDGIDALLYASRQYAYDCGEDSGGESSNKKKKGGNNVTNEELRNATLPSWMRGEQ